MDGVIVELTDLGRSKALEIKGSGPRYNILTELYESGRLSLDDLAGEVDLTDEKAEMVVNSLVKKNLVRIVS